MTEAQRLQRAVGAAMACLRDLSANITAAETLAYINSLLNPPPEHEEVTIERWMVIEPDGNIVGISFTTEEQADTYIGNMLDDTDQYSKVKLAGTAKRLKPQKVEKSVSVEGGLTEMGNLLCAGSFKTHTSAHGKYGTLTFTWTE